MNRKNVFNGIILLLLCAGLFYACREEAENSGSDSESASANIISGSNSELTKTAAMKWYAEHNTPVVEMRSGSSNKKVSGKLVAPRWDRAKEYRKGRKEVVETPLNTQIPGVIMDKETSMRVDWEKDAVRIRNAARMVILKDLDTGEIQNFIMIFVGSYDYLMNTRNIMKNTYLHREKDFDGSVLFFIPGGGLANGWIYRKGKIVNKIYPGEDTPDTGFQTRGGDCWREVEYVDVEYCDEIHEYDGDVEWNEEFGSFITPDLIVTVVCYTIREARYHTECEEIDNKGSGSGNQGGYNPGAGGGSKFSSIYNGGSTLSTEEKNKLIAAFQSLIDTYPQFANMINSLINKGKTIIFKIDPDISSAAVFKPNEGTIYFNSINSIYTTYLFHEILHAVQLYDVYSLDKMTDKKNFFNIELEVHLIMDIINVLNNSEFKVADAYTVGWSELNNEDVKKLLDDIFKDVKQNGCFNQGEVGTIEKIGESWTMYFGEYNYQFPPNMILKYVSCSE